MEIDVRKKGQVNILEMTGRVTIGEGDVALREKIVGLLDSGERLFILNMGRVSFMDSAGIGETVASGRRIMELGGSAKLVLLEGKVREVFVLTGLDRSFDIYDDEDEAVASFMRSV